VYALYPFGWLVSGHWSLFASQKGYLLARFLGIIHDTGLTRQNTHVTFLTLLLINVRQYASSYILLALGGLSGIWMLLRANRRSTAVVGMWAVVASIWTAFETVHGLAEEEFYYYAIIPAAITLGALVATLVSAVWDRPDGRPVVRFRALPFALLALVGLAALVSDNGRVWARYYASPDDAILQMRQYLDHRLPPRTAIIVGDEMDGPSFARDTARLIRIRGVSEHALSQYKTLDPADIRALARAGAHYVILSTKDVYIGYGVMSRRAARYVHNHGTIVYAPYSTTYWHVQLVRLHSDVWSGGTPANSLPTSTGSYRYTSRTLWWQLKQT
jgi:hypothetical protein